MATLLPLHPSVSLVTPSITCFFVPLAPPFPPFPLVTAFLPLYEVYISSRGLVGAQRAGAEWDISLS